MPSPPASPLGSACSDDASDRDIVPRRSPTPTFQPLCPEKLEVAAVEVEVVPRRGGRFPTHESEAAKYLLMFHSSTSVTFVRRSRVKRVRSNASTALSSAPSLSHTPTSSASSSIPYSPSMRPLPSRTSPYSSYFGPRSVELVTPLKPVPITAPASLANGSPLKGSPVTRISTSVVEGQDLYEKRMTIASTTPTQGNLKHLFDLSDVLPSLLRAAEPKAAMAS